MERVNRLSGGGSLSSYGNFRKQDLCRTDDLAAMKVRRQFDDSDAGNTESISCIASIDYRTSASYRPLAQVRVAQRRTLFKTSG